MAIEMVDALIFCCRFFLACFLSAAAALSLSSFSRCSRSSTFHRARMAFILRRSSFAAQTASSPALAMAIILSTDWRAATAAVLPEDGEVAEDGLLAVVGVAAGGTISSFSH